VFLGRIIFYSDKLCLIFSENDSKCHSLYIIHKLDFTVIVLLTQQTFALSFKVCGTFPIHYSASYSQHYTAYALSKLRFIKKRVYIPFERCLIVSQLVLLIDH